MSWVFCGFTQYSCQMVQLSQQRNQESWCHERSTNTSISAESNFQTTEPQMGATLPKPFFFLPNSKVIFINLFWQISAIDNRLPLPAWYCQTRFDFSEQWQEGCFIIEVNVHSDLTTISYIVWTIYIFKKKELFQNCILKVKLSLNLVLYIIIKCFLCLTAYIFWH